MLEKLKKMLLATKILLSFERRTGQVIIAKPPRPLSPAPAKCYNQDASIKASRTERDRRPQSLTGISPAACICCSIRRKFAKTRRPVSARCLAFASPVLVYFPCRSCAAESLCSPAIVRVPVALPPCNWQRVLPFRAGF
jgi:hypothetical protein